jgi:hypothetical protein
MDTSLPANSALIFKIKKEASESGVFEAFLESAPQFILQSSIVLRTGNICKILPFLLFLIHFLKVLANQLSSFQNIFFQPLPNVMVSQ